jgi:hypothetical protein
MIVKWFKYGSGNGKAAFAYLLNHRVHDKTAKVLRGNPNLTLSIIQSLQTKKRYKSGCLSFEESAENITEHTKQAIMDLFEQTVFPSMDESNRNICWVEHSDKGRLELNFVIPRVELSTYKAFNPYYHRNDKARFEAFRDYINKKYQFSDPNDPNKQQRLNLGGIVKYTKAAQIKHLDLYMTELIESGVIQNREGVIEELKALGYEISRKGRDYLSIKPPQGKAMRLKGKYYSEAWETSVALPSEGSSVKVLWDELQEQIKKASEYAIKNFSYCIEDEKKVDGDFRNVKEIALPSTNYPKLMRSTIMDEKGIRPLV